jgi:hypothetical protein
MLADQTPATFAALHNEKASTSPGSIFLKDGIPSNPDILGSL